MLNELEDAKKIQVRDFVWEGIESGWKHIDASLLPDDKSITADVVIIGTGSGGGTAAEILAQAGLDVVIVEEGPLQTSRNFNMSEAEAYSQLYQEAGARMTRDKAIVVFQGRMVGGSTGVNWTTSFRTPTATMDYWNSEFGLKEFTAASMQPWFEHVEKRYNINYWKAPPNQNNATIARGCEKLGIHYGHIQRNVRGCQNLGYCGVGCPVNAKQSTLVTSIPGALRAGATLVSRARGESLTLRAGKVQGIKCVAMNPLGSAPSGKTLNIKARHVVLAAGAIGSPSVLLRSGDAALNPHSLVGKRTFLHPVAVSYGLMPHPVNGDAGAPQSIYSDHYIKTRLDNQQMGYKIEVAPMQPLFVSTLTPPGSYGKAHADIMQQRPNLTVGLALMRDGFHPESVGGSVFLKNDGTPGLDYPITDYVWSGLRDSLIKMADIQFAAGAKKVLPVHRDSQLYSSMNATRSAVDKLSMQIHQMMVGSAHVMGGCMMGADPRKSVVSSMGQHHEVENLSIFDGSTFPTSIAANPMESVHSMVAMQATALASTLTGAAVNPE